MLLNLHTHSNYSDGSHSIRELAEAYKAAGHIALCLTDHNYLLTKENWFASCSEAEKISSELDFPIIVGLEVFIRGIEEVLVFGHDACLATFDLPDSSEHVTLDAFKNWYHSLKTPVALILAHPCIWSFETELYLMLDGYEIMNSGLSWEDDPSVIAKLQDRMPLPRRPYKNHDTHNLSDLRFECNSVAEDLIIKNEADLIKYLSVDKGVIPA